MENVQNADPYAIVLADLKAKRDQIDQTIAMLTALRLGGASPASALSNDASNAATSAIEETAGMYLGMSLPEAAKKLLASRKRAMTNIEIATALQQGGLVMKSADPKNTIGSVLTRRFNDVGDIVRVDRGTWGLKDWYPGRTFKTSIRVPRDVVEPPADQHARDADQAFNDIFGDVGTSS